MYGSGILATGDVLLPLIDRLFNSISNEDLCLSLKHGDKYFSYRNKLDLFFANETPISILGQNCITNFGLPHFALNKFINALKNKFDPQSTNSLIKTIGFHSIQNRLQCQNLNVNDIQIIQNADFAYYLVFFNCGEKRPYVYGTKPPDVFTNSRVYHIACWYYNIGPNNQIAIKIEWKFKLNEKFSGLVAAMWCADLMHNGRNLTNLDTREKIDPDKLFNWFCNCIENNTVTIFTNQ